MTCLILHVLERLLCELLELLLLGSERRDLLALLRQNVFRTLTHHEPGRHHNHHHPSWSTIIEPQRPGVLPSKRGRLIERTFSAPAWIWAISSSSSRVCSFSFCMSAHDKQNARLTVSHPLHTSGACPNLMSLVTGG
jgi:hypothetical protein